MSERPVLGYIGIGLMGKPMALRLLAAGYKVAVWNRSAEKLAPVVAKGALAKATPAEVASAADIIMMCVTDQNSTRAVLFGKGGVVEGEAKGKIIIDFSSIAPAAAREISEKLAKLDIGYIDAPVSGGTPGAEAGTLAIMAGGKAEHIDFVRPLVAELSSRFTRMGDSGAGQVTKLCNQIIVGSLLPVIAEAVRLAEAAGVDAKMLPEAFKGGFADSKPLQVFGARMAAHAWEPALAATNVMLKDLKNALEAAGNVGVPLPMVSAAMERYQMLVSKGLGDAEPSAFVDFLNTSTVGKS